MTPPDRWEPVELGENPPLHTEQADRWWHAGRSALLAMIAVMAMAVWAINIGYLVREWSQLSTISIVARLLILDAVPVATLWVIFRGLGQGRSLENTLQNIARSMLGNRFGRDDTLL